MDSFLYYQHTFDAVSNHHVHVWKFFYKYSKAIINYVVNIF